MSFSGRINSQKESPFNLADLPPALIAINQKLGKAFRLRMPERTKAREGTPGFCFKQQEKLHGRRGSRSKQDDDRPQHVFAAIVPYQLSDYPGRYIILNFFRPDLRIAIGENERLALDDQYIVRADKLLPRMGGKEEKTGIGVDRSIGHAFYVNHVPNDNHRCNQNP